MILKDIKILLKKKRIKSINNIKIFLKKKKRHCGCKLYKNLLEEEKQMLVEYRKNNSKMQKMKNWLILFITKPGHCMKQKCFLIFFFKEKCTKVVNEIKKFQVFYFTD